MQNMTAEVDLESDRLIDIIVDSSYTGHTLIYESIDKERWELFTKNMITIVDQ